MINAPQQKDLFTKRWRNVRALDPSEVQIQISLVDRLNLLARPDVLWFHVPNGELRDKRVAAKLKAMGERPGVADLIFLWPSGQAGKFPGIEGCTNTLFLELKSRRGRLEAEQLTFRNAAHCAGAYYEHANTIDEAVAILIRYGILPEEPKFK